MKLFLAKIGLFSAIQMLLFIGLHLISPNREDPYFAAMVDKHEMARSTPGQRIFLVGGSNLAFGIDSAEIFHRIGYRPINLAIYAGLGLDFILNEAEDLASSGDAIVLSIEYEHFHNDVTMYQALHFVKCDPTVVEYFSWSQIKKLLDSGFPFLAEYLRSTIKGPKIKPGEVRLVRNSFNEFGDIVAHHDAPSIYPGTQTTTELPINSETLNIAIDKLQRFVNRCHERGIDVYYAHPPMAADRLPAMRNFVESIDSRIRADLNVPILCSAKELLYPEHLFYDTCYHLTKQGKERRTDLLIDRLQPLLSRPAMVGRASLETDIR